MVAINRILREPEVVWRTANPVWRDYTVQSDPQDRIAVRMPNILRFDNDTFVEDFMSVLQTAPARMREWQVGKETWRLPFPTASLADGRLPAPNWQPPQDPPELLDDPLKLYQPAHERYYLVTASLVCRIPGLPDKMLDLSANERVTFVLRRIMRPTPSSAPIEYAFVNGMWHAMDTNQTRRLHRTDDGLVEEQYPMFPSCYTDDLTGRQRRVLAGLIPVGQRETFFTAGRAPVTPDGSSNPASALSRADKLMTIFDVDVMAPWQSIVRQVEVDGSYAGSAFRSIDESWMEITKLSGSEKTAAIENLRVGTNKVRDQIQLSSWYTLLDFAYFLDNYLPDVWHAIANSTNGAGLTGKRKDLYDLLKVTRFKSGSSDIDFKSDFYDRLEGESTTNTDSTMVNALKSVWDVRLTTSGSSKVGLEDAVDPYPSSSVNWPSVKFLLTGVEVRSKVRYTVSLDANSIEHAIREALETTNAPIGERLPQLPTAKLISENTVNGDYDDNEFVIRCVYERPNCPPGVRPEIVSIETQAFTLAAFFDPDAPARPIKIPMPVDTSPAGIRKFAKNTMFVLSDTLACQVEAARNITFGDLVLSVLPWPFHKDLPDVGAGDCKPGLSFGTLCTLSIPIITICALILLIIVVGLLNIIFNWIPFLIFCLPLPGLKSKD